MPLVEVLRRYPQQVLLAIGARVGVGRRLLHLHAVHHSPTSRPTSGCRQYAPQRRAHRRRRPARRDPVLRACCPTGRPAAGLLGRRGRARRSGSFVVLPAAVDTRHVRADRARARSSRCLRTRRCTARRPRSSPRCSRPRCATRGLDGLPARRDPRRRAGRRSSLCALRRPVRHRLVGARSTSLAMLAGHDHLRVRSRRRRRGSTCTPSTSKDWRGDDAADTGSTSTPTSASRSAAGARRRRGHARRSSRQANVACGFHAGDPRHRCGGSVRAAAERGVVVGAQVGYRDLAGFGRRFIDVDAGRADRRRALPDRRARRARAGWPGTRGALREAARRALQRDRAPRGAGRRGGRGRAGVRRRRCRCSACPARRCSRRPRRRGCARCGEFFVDRGYTPEGDARAALAGRARCCTTRTRSRRGWCGMVDGGRGDRGRRHRRRRPRRVGVRARRLARRGRDGRCAVRDGLAAAGVDACGRSHERCSPIRRSDGPRVLVDGRRGCSWSRRLDAGSPARPRSRRRLAGVVDVVPAARTVLLTVAPGHRPRRAAPGRPGPARRRRSTRPDGETVEIPVVYDGPDLAEVAELTGLDVDEVVAAHTGTPWRVGVRRLRPGLRLPDRRRRAAARAAPRRAAHHGAGRRRRAGRRVQRRLPAPSPGGWQLIGRPTPRCGTRTATHPRSAANPGGVGCGSSRRARP